MLVCNSGVFTWCVRWGLAEGREGEGEEGAEKPRAPIHGVFKPAQMVKVLGPLGWRVGTGYQVGEAVMEWHIRAPRTAPASPGEEGLGLGAATLPDAIPAV